MAQPRIHRAYLLLLAVVLALTASAFDPSAPGSRNRGVTRPTASGPEAVPAAVPDAVPAAFPDAVPAADGSSAPTENAFPFQSEYGKSLPFPNSYASCGVCGVSFAMTEETFGASKAGRRMECSVCDHTWFQSRDRLAQLGDSFEMIPSPERDLERIKQNIEEGRHPKYCGDFKMYVGNISFKCDEQDIWDFFEAIGPVGDVSLVRGEDGRPRGFGFVTMRTTEDGEKCLKELDGVDLKGRNLNVRPATN